MLTLIERLRERAHDPKRATDEGRSAGDAAPSTEAQVAAAEKALGFRLPILLRQIFLEVGNGGFGPGDGLRGLPTGPGDVSASVVGQYTALRRKNPAWPPGLIPLCAWGSGIESYADCSRPEAPVIRLDPNMPPADVAVRVPAARHYDRAAAVGAACWVENAALETWIEVWADGGPLFYLAYGGAEDGDEEDAEEDGGEEDDGV